MADYLSAPSPPPNVPPPPPLTPPGYDPRNFVFTPSAIAASVIGGFIGLCLFCVVFCKLCYRVVDQSVRMRQQNFFNHETHKV